jgi:hypothetical protein
LVFFLRRLSVVAGRFFSGQESLKSSSPQPGPEQRPTVYFATRTHQKEDSMVYGGTPDHLFPSCLLSDDSTLLLMSHNLR